MNPFSCFGSLLQEYYVQKIRAVNAGRNERLAALSTRAEAEAYLLSVRKKIAAAFPMPKRKCALKARVTGRSAYKDFTLEKVIFESRPDFPVTANFYLPAGKGPFPSVLFLCGHSEGGKGDGVYQTACQGLALQGYAVLCIDPAGQGERWQFLDLPEAQGIHGICTREHNMLGKQQLLTGEYFGAWRAWDAVRAVDYMLTRTDVVDPARLGVTGNSGGGTMTTFVNALEPRFTMAAPSCYVTSWQRNIENELPADIEQIPPGILAAGCEMGDFLIARAPRPVLILGQKNDFFDPRGTRDTFEQVRRFYRLLGHEEDVQLFIGPCDHGYSRENREAMYRFFNRHAGVAGKGNEPRGVAPLPLAELCCTASGQTGREPGVKYIRDFTRERGDELAAARKKLSAEELRKHAAKLLALPRKTVLPYVRALRHTLTDPGLPFARVYSRFGLETEPGILAVLKIVNNGTFHIPQADRVLLYVAHQDAQSEMQHMALPEDGAMLCGLDVRGIGETLPSSCDQDDDRSFYAAYGFDYHYASLGLMFDDPLLGSRVRDVLGALAVLHDRGAKKIRLAGRGLGAVVAAFAALESDLVSGVTLWDAPRSYDSMLRTPVTMWPQSIMLPGVLKKFDLPDVYEALKRKKGRVANFLDDMMRK